jgi:ATP-dependent helicase HepA
VKKGDFVRLEGENLEAYGIGKIEGHEDGIVTVAFFDSPVADLIKIQAPISALRPAKVLRQTRAYWFDVGQNVWRVGRVMSHDEADHEVEVRFPNQKDMFLPASDVFVRWDKPLEDPSGYLSRKINETPLFSDARSRYVKALMGQRRATMGMPALFSSIIDLEPHQIEVVRRILQDPVQRYLLADEVGLGKTIEAGVLIRQYVLDDPAGHRVAVIVPPALVLQWRDELSRRFLLEVELDDSVNVVPSDNPDEVRESLHGAGMVVLDEAHHIHQGHWLFDLLAEETSHLQRFLLLSATPVLGNEAGFLEMLHLLDPLVFPLGKLETFRRKIENRQGLAEAVAGLIPENLLQLEDYLDSLSEMFPDDDELASLSSRLRVVVDRFPEEHDPEFLEALSELRSHVAETYRLDRRILRNRRKGVPGLTPDRAGVSFADYNPPSMAAFAEALEDWRRSVTLSLAEDDESEKTHELAAWFFDVLGALAVRTLPDTLISSLIKPRLAKASGDEALALEEILHRLQLLGTEKDSLFTVLDLIEASEPQTKFIVFCSASEVADRVQEGLAARLSMPIDRYDEDLLEDYAESVFARFQNDPRHRVIVCDQRAEEGLNLQGGDKVLIHFDLPYSPNRIEQRIGRVDRYGTGASVQSIVIRCNSNPFEVAWSHCLSEGLEVFNRSVASLQYLIDEQMRALKRQVLLEGIDAISEMQERLGGADGTISKELRRIDDQDALDALIVPPEESYDDLFAEDDNWREFQEAVDGWLIGILNMRKTDGPDVGPLPKGDAITRYMLSHRGGNETLIPLDRFLDNFISVLDSEAHGSSYSRPLSFPYTSRRRTSLLEKAREERVRLLRYGDTFLKGLTDLTTLDDRGRSVALWRQRAAYEPEGIADLYFRFDFLIEANVEEAARLYASAMEIDTETALNALRRRGDMTFPPAFHQIWLDGELEPVSDETTLKLLAEPYLQRTREDANKDLNLNWERWDKLKAIELPVIDYWSDMVQDARERAEASLGQQIDLGYQIEEALKVAKNVDQARFAQLQTRIRHADDAEASFEKKLLSIETSTAESFYQGIRDPKITLDMIGAVFLSPHALDYLALKAGHAASSRVAQ